MPWKFSTANHAEKEVNKKVYYLFNLVSHLAKLFSSCDFQIVGKKVTGKEEIKSPF